jgi:hypothetical protein
MSSHNVDMCACGECHKKRVAAGTDGEYTRRLRAATVLAGQEKSQVPPKLERKSGPVSKLQEADLGDVAKNLFPTLQAVNHA